MHINPAIEPWLERLLEGVRNGNNDAEVMATKAFHSTALLEALEEWASDYDGWSLDEIRKRTDPATLRRLDRTRKAIAAATEPQP